MEEILMNYIKVKRRPGFYMAVILSFCQVLFYSCNRESQKKPNILFAISDDQGYHHASAYGCKFVRTPGFDRIAEKGALFHNVYCAIPQCSPNRASILTGKYLWKNEEASTHASLFPSHLKIFTDIFLDNGYMIRFTGKK